MSYMAEHPEKYDELVRKGILTYLELLMYRAGFEVPGEWRNGYEALIEVLQREPSVRSTYDTLIQRASTHILDAEADHYGSLLDQVKERFDA